MSWVFHPGFGLWITISNVDRPGLFQYRRTRRGTAEVDVSDRFIDVGGTTMVSGTGVLLRSQQHGSARIRGAAIGAGCADIRDGLGRPLLLHRGEPTRLALSNIPVRHGCEYRRHAIRTRTPGWVYQPTFAALCHGRDQLRRILEMVPSIPFGGCELDKAETNQVGVLWPYRDHCHLHSCKSSPHRWAG